MDMPCPEKFKQTLVDYNVDETIRNQINDGYENLVSSSGKHEKAEYFIRAMEILDRSIPKETEIALMDENGCCKGGTREKNSKQFAKENKDKSLEEKLALIPAVPYMGVPKLVAKNQILIDAINYYDGESFRCACPNFKLQKSYEQISKSYCYCCSGHFRHHYEIMLNKKLQLLKVVSSPLGEDGQKPCAFLFEIVGEK